MTNNESELKAAFFALLNNYQNDIGELADNMENDYCHRFCPLAHENCPAKIYEDDPEDDTEDDAEDWYIGWGIDEDKCRDAILNWYMENYQ